MRMNRTVHQKKVNEADHQNLLVGVHPKKSQRWKHPKKEAKKKSGPSTAEEEEEEERQSGNTEQKSKSKQHRPSRRAQQSRVGRSKQAATKENDSSEEIDVFQGSSPVNDENPQEETEEDEVSTVNVRRRGSKRERRWTDAVNNFLCESFGKKWLSSFRLSKAFDAQNGTAEEWTVGPYSDDLMCLWSHALAMRMVTTLTVESYERV